MNTDQMFTDFENIVREQFEQNNANTITFDKFENVITKVLIDHITDEQRNQYERFLYWIRNEDLDNAHIVCANVELVRFGAIAARPDRSKVSGHSNGPTLAKFDHLTKFLKDTAKITNYITKQRYPNTVESRAQLIDQFVEKTMS